MTLERFAQDALLVPFRQRNTPVDPMYPFFLWLKGDVNRVPRIQATNLTNALRGLFYFFTLSDLLTDDDPDLIVCEYPRLREKRHYGGKYSLSAQRFRVAICYLRTWALETP